MGDQPFSVPGVRAKNALRKGALLVSACIGKVDRMSSISGWTHKMPVDNCHHDFDALAAKVLPGYLKQLQAAIDKPHKAAEFAKPGVGPVAIAKTLGHEADFSGCYVLLEKSAPIYVGISRSVLSRIRQHVTGKSHFDASLVYAVAQRRFPTKGKRGQVMEDAGFRGEFEKAQQYLRGLSVAFIEIENPLELYVFEAYAAMALDTAEWNTFRTH